jgi:hypothetical protein
MSQAPNRFDIALDDLASRKAPSPRIQKTTSDRFAIPTESRHPTISTQNFIPKTDSRFGEIDTSEIEITRYAHHRKPEYKVDARFGTIEVQVPEERRRERAGPSDRFSSIVSERQDPRHMARSGPRSEHPPTTKVSIRNTFVDLIDNAIVKLKTIAPVPESVSGGAGAGAGAASKKSKSNKKKTTANLDDLDDDMPITSKTNKAILAKFAEEEVDEEDQDSNENTDEQALTGKAAKQQRKRERLIAEGRGYVYDQKY